MQKRLSIISNSVANIPENKKAWQNVCDILATTNFIHEERTKYCPNTERYLQDILPDAIKFSDVVHTMETVPVYILMKDSDDNKVIIVTISSPEDDVCIPVMFTEEDAKNTIKEIDGLEAKDTIIVKIPFFVLIDGQFGFIPEDDAPDIILFNDDGMPMPRMNRYDVMLMMLDSTFALRSNYARDVYLSEASAFNAQNGKNLVNAQSPMSGMAIRNKKLPVS